MNIKIVVPSISRLGGGVAEAARLHVCALQLAKSMHVNVVTLRDEFFSTDVRRWPDVKISAYRYFGPANYGFSPGLLLNLLFDRQSVVHVHGLWMFQCLAVLIANIVCGTRYVVTPHGMLEKWILGRSPTIKWVVSLLYQNKFLLRASAIQVLTVKERVDVENISCGDVFVIPNYVASHPYDDVAPPSWWRDAYDSKKMFLFLGRIHSKKGWFELCEAWNAVCKSSVRFRSESVLVFCGWGEESEQLKHQVDALNAIFGNVLFAGAVIDQQKWASLRVAHFLVLPSKSEGLPMSVLEAWSMGKVSLMSSNCNLPIGFDNHIALDCGCDIASIRDGLLKASEMTGIELAIAGERCSAVISEHFSQKMIGSKLVKMYAVVCGQKV